MAVTGCFGIYLFGLVNDLFKIDYIRYFRGSRSLVRRPDGSFQVLGDVVEDCHSYGCFFTF